MPKYIVSLLQKTSNDKNMTDKKPELSDAMKKKLEPRKFTKNPILGTKFTIAISSAKGGVGKSTFAALTNNEVITDLFPDSPKAGLEHINLSFDLDLILVMPATANVLSKVANGIADDIVSTTLSVCEQPTIFAPAMNYKMWQNKSIIESVDKLKSMNKIIINPESGYLASLHEGEGRLANINTITYEIRSVLEIKQPLKNKNILIFSFIARSRIWFGISYQRKKICVKKKNK